MAIKRGLFGFIVIVVFFFIIGALAVKDVFFANKVFDNSVAEKEHKKPIYTAWNVKVNGVLSSDCKWEAKFSKADYYKDIAYLKDIFVVVSSDKAFVSVKSEESEYKDANKIFYFESGVDGVLTTSNKSYKFFSKEAEFDTKKGVLFLSGDVVLQWNDGRLFAKSLFIDVVSGKILKITVSDGVRANVEM